MTERCTVSLIVDGQTVDPDDVTKTLGLEPTWQRRVGEPSHPSDRPSRRGTWKRSAVGPTPVGAPKLANDLVRDLLAPIPNLVPSWSGSGHDVDIVLSFAVHTLLTFSYELTPSVAARIGEVGTAFVCRIDDLDANGRGGSFDAPDATEHEVSMSLRVLGNDLDPERVTSSMGFAPTSSGRAGEPVKPGAARTFPRGFWVHSIGSRPPQRVNQLVRTFLDRLSGQSIPWDVLRRDYELRARLSFTVEGLTGYFYLDASILRELAVLGCPLDFEFYNLGA